MRLCWRSYRLTKAIQTCRDSWRSKSWQMGELNTELGTKYKDYLDYLEDNIGDDADFTMDELKALLEPERSGASDLS